MRKIVVFNMMSVDGYFAGTDANIDWHVTDSEFDRWALETMKEFDTILFGRVTYQLFENYWPDTLNDKSTSKENQLTAQAINDMQKIVFSTTLKMVDWNQSKLIKYITAEEIKKLKQQQGKNIVIYGSGTIVRALAKLGAIDEYRFMVNPVILGRGRSLFEGDGQVKLELLDTKKFKSGSVLVMYRPAQIADKASFN